MTRNYEYTERDAQIIALANRLGAVLKRLPTCIEVHEQAGRKGIGSVSPDNVHSILWKAGIPHSQAGNTPYRLARREEALAQSPEADSDLEPEPAGETEINRDVRLRYAHATGKEWKRKYEDALDALGRQQRLQALFAEKMEALPPPLPLAALRPHVGTHSQDAIAFLACLHFGEVVSFEETGGLGDYDIAMAQARMQYYVDSTLDLAFNHHAGEEFGKLWVVDAGDNISGLIHEELERTNERDVADQVFGAAMLMSNALRDWAAYFPQVVFVGLPGNHGRMRVKKGFKQVVGSSFDTLVYYLVRERVRDIPNVEVHIPRSFFTLETINGHNFCFTHGDMARSWLRIPYYGIERLRREMADLLRRIDQEFEYFCMSHFHVNATIQETSGETILTGSSKGPCEYSTGAKAVGSDPTWQFIGVHEKRGVSFRYPVNMKTATRGEYTRYQS